MTFTAAKAASPNAATLKNTDRWSKVHAVDTHSGGRGSAPPRRLSYHDAHRPYVLPNTHESVPHTARMPKVADSASTRLMGG